LAEAAIPADYPGKEDPMEPVLPAETPPADTDFDLDVRIRPMAPAERERPAARRPTDWNTCVGCPESEQPVCSSTC
jgi:hypothetical protein